MRGLQRIKKNLITYVCLLLVSIITANAYADIDVGEASTIDRIQLVTRQINLLKDRLTQSQLQYKELQSTHDQRISQLSMDKASKSLLDKAALDISVAKSNLDSINIELADTQQTINWLDKNIQEIENQLNILSVFSLKLPSEDVTNVDELLDDLSYQKKLLKLEKVRIQYIQDLQKTIANILQLKKENYNRLNILLKSHKMLHIKQQQVKDELAFQEQQNYWLQQLTKLYAKLATLDPAKSRESYSLTEQAIFYSNENANFAYTQSLIARYKDQIQQMKLGIQKNNSISLLNETSDQVQILTKQINRLENVLQIRLTMLEKHIAYLKQRKKNQDTMRNYLANLSSIVQKYKESDNLLIKLNQDLYGLRRNVDQALQNELSSRQGLPTFSLKTMVDLGKEMLLVPDLTFQVVKSLSGYMLKAVKAQSFIVWSILIVIETLSLFSLFFLYKFLLHVINKPSQWREQLNSKWLSLQWLRRNYLDLIIIGHIVGIMYFFALPAQSYMFIVYLSIVWLVLKGVLTIARLCLVETIHQATGQDVKLYKRLKWITVVGGIIVALSVFMQQLPLIYELKTLSNQLLLLFLMLISLLLLRSWDVIPNLILSRMETYHPYLQKSIRLIGILLPIIILGNSVLGLIGYMNLVMTISWYEGIFLLVLAGYLTVRGFLSDGMEQVSRLIIHYSQNGWLWTEAFLKPIDKIIRLALFLSSWAILFLLYGWDDQSPIVERLARLLHYQFLPNLNNKITPIAIIELMIVISTFYWIAKWTREFIYRILSTRTNDIGIRNSLAILTQYSVVIIGVFIGLKVLGIDLKALYFVASMLAFGIGFGLRDLANNFACGFLILLERPLRVGDIVNVNNIEGEVTHIGGRAVSIKTWDHMELVVPNAEIFNKSFTNWTARDNIIRTIVPIKISRYDNPHQVKTIIYNVLAAHKNVLQDPAPEVLLKEMSDTLIQFEVRYFVNVRQVKSRVSVMSEVLMNLWDAFAQHNIKPPYPQQEIFLRSEAPALTGNNLQEIENKAS